MKETVWKIKKFEDLTTEELYQILKARVDVFVVEQNCPYPELDDYDQKAVHLWAEKNGEVISYCRIFDIDIKYEEASIGRVLTKINYRHLKLGSVLMRLALATIEGRFGTRKVRISAQDYLLNFYQIFGFRDTGKKYLEDDIPHTEMFKNE